MPAKIAFIFLGSLLFLFVFWKRLKEDYSSEIIFQSSLFILTGLFIGFILSKTFIPEWFFWLSFLGSLTGMALSIFKFRLRFYETSEALFLSSIPFVSLMFFVDSVTNSSLNSFLAFAGTLVLIFLAFWFDTNYKNYSWYKSGRVGFAGFAISSIFFTTRMIIAISGIGVLSFVGKLEVFASGIVAFTLLLLLFYLGRKE